MSAYDRSHRTKRRELIRARAHAMRHSPSAAEAACWRAVRGRALGVQFRRQYPIGNFIADFCAPSVRLIVEIDGSWHDGRATADRRRDRMLTRAGYQVLRFTNRDVETDLAAVVAAVRAAVGAT